MHDEFDKAPPSPDDGDLDFADLDQLEWELNNMNGKGVLDPTPETIAAEWAEFERALVKLESYAWPKDDE